MAPSRRRPHLPRHCKACPSARAVQVAAAGVTRSPRGSTSDAPALWKPTHSFGTRSPSPNPSCSAGCCARVP
eukprot:scaffold5028_cov381-Prasinococcus_capsulatus_cf.AAC.7